MNRRSVLEFSPGAAGLLLGREDGAHWRDAALCSQADPDSWFPLKGSTPARVKRICRACPSRTPCLAFALETAEQWGVWAGFSERELRKLRQSGRTAAEIIADDEQQRKELAA